MQDITSALKLKEAILQLESERVAKKQLLKDDFHQVYEGIKPVNLINNTLDDVASSPLLIENMIGTALGLVTGYVTKKIIVGKSDSKLRKLLGTVVEFSIINLVGRRPIVMPSLGRFLLHCFIQKKRCN
ncbi:MAG: hypothetical protein WC341_13710 [Bacteroidales bacterium]|jgi:hypothetical protein